MKFMNYEIRSMFLLALPVVLFDQAAKIWVRLNLPVGQVLFPESPLSQAIRIIHVHNFGGLGGFLYGQVVFLALVSLAICLAAAFIYACTAPEERLGRFALALLFGGGLGNLIDRLLLGYVTDFISIMTLPTFNLADLAVGAGALLLAIWLYRRPSPISSKSAG